MARRLVVLVVLAVGLTVSATAAADHSGRIASLRARAAAARQREAVLNAQIADTTRRIRVLERTIGDVAQRVAILERDLELHRRRLARLNALFALETHRLELLRRGYAAAVRSLGRRLVQIYESPDPSALEVVLAAKSVEDAVDELRYLKAVAREDRQITQDVGTARDEMRLARARTKKVRSVVAAETQVVAVRTQQQRELRDQLLASQHRLAGARAGKRHTLAATRAQEREWVSEANTLAAEDARIRAQLAAARARSSAPAPADTTPSSSGLIWPVNGPVTSPFGYRWGRLHAGIDIGVPNGTPIHAAAAGTVAIAGWVGGYGNYTCINHGGGLATCYGHQSSIAVSVGQQVAQGQVIGYTGCTGHCFGPHLHFEVRINGSPVDPLGYL